MSPQYVEYGALMTPPAPFRSLGAKVWGFVFEADRDRLAALTRKVFSDPTGATVDVEPLGQHVILTWGRIQGVHSLTPGFDQRGAVAEPQVVVWIPVVRNNTFSMFVPYLWVDNAMSLATGRELFGYPKSWSWIGFPDEPETNGSWTLDVFGLDYAPDGLAARHPLMKIERGEGTGAAAEDHPSLLHIARHVGMSILETARPDHLLRDAAMIPKLASDVSNHEFPHLFLKQFRSIEDGTEACLQQVTECRYRVTRIRAQPSLHEHTLTVSPLDSQPVIAELGLEGQDTHLSYEIDMDFDVGWGRVLWDSSAHHA